jgi:hypothetical protein
MRRAQDRKLVTCINVPDEFAMLACLNFAGLRQCTISLAFSSSLTRYSPDDHKTMVELAAGATLSVAYSPGLFRRIFPDALAEKRNTIVFVVCGGFKITLADLNSYQTHLEACRSKEFDMWIDNFHFRTRTE